MGRTQLPQDRLWLLREMAQATLHYSDSKHISSHHTKVVHWGVVDSRAGIYLSSALSQELT